MNKLRRYENTLELNKILKMLSNKALCDETKKRISEILPSYSFEKTKLLLKQTEDAHMLIARFGSPSFVKMPDVTNSLSRAKAGGILTMSELLNIGRVLSSFRALKTWKSRAENISTCLDDYFEAVVSNKYFEDKILSSILSDEEIADNASNELFNIRRKIKSLSQKVRQQLDKLIHSQVYQKYLQDPIITLREGRFVVPVKSEHRYDVKGLVHDTSSTGSTIFIEPLSVVETNNEIKVLESKEKAEIEKILLNLSSEAGEFSDTIIKSYEASIEIDLIFAKAELAYQMNASVPKINDKGEIHLKKARHPLIDKEKVVPIDIELGKDFDSLVITGPNTGGKTVSIKTVGLLSLMTMCGLMIPALENSEVAVFEKVLVDIGDEQSIEQSLSTFSSHITNIISIMDEADANSLILLDELGSGTDPIEGAALATAILESLREKGAKIAATTHYAEIKEYALKTERVENGCCEFDVNTLRPTYKLLIGIPGRSNAFEISTRLGMNPAIVKTAKKYISADKNKFEEIVRTLEETRADLEREYKEAQDKNLEVEKLREEVKRELSRVKNESKIQIEKAKEKASSILNRTKAQAEDIMDELTKSKKKKGLSPEETARLKAKIRELENLADPVDKRKQTDYKLPRKLKKGDNILIFDIDKKGTVLEEEDSSGYVLVQAGIIKTRVSVKNLRLLGDEVKKKVSTGAFRTVKSIAQREANMEIDLRGYTALEAIMELDSFIDRAVLNGMHQVTVIHGKGTGVLRKEIQAHLKKHSSVKSYRLGVFGEGESGVTIVELK